MDKRIKNLIKSIAIVIIGIAVILGTFCILQYNDTKSRVPKNLITSDKVDTEVIVDLIDDKLAVALDKVAINLRTKAVIYNYSPKDDVLLTNFEITDNSLFTSEMEMDESSNTVRIIKNNREGLTLDASNPYINFSSEEISSIVDSYEEKSILKDKTYTPDETIYDFNIYEKSRIYSLYKEGYTFEYTISDSDETAEDYRYRLAFEEKTDGAKYLNILGLNKINVDDIPEIKGHSGISYNSGYNLVYVFNTEGDTYEVVLFITNMNNEALSNVVEKLIQYKNYQNVFIDAGFKSNADFGYGGFAVLTNKGMYYFKIGEGVENPEQFMNNIIKMLGISESDKAIDRDFEIILTIDDMLPQNTKEQNETE